MSVQFDKNKMEAFVKQYLISAVINHRGLSYDYKGHYYLHIRIIKKIDNVEVMVTVQLDTDGLIYLNIKHLKTRVLIYQRLIKEVVSENKLELSDMLSALVDCHKVIVRSITTLKFKKTFYELSSLEIDDELCDMFGVDINDCCICYDKIAYKTPCGHDVCYDCYNKMFIPFPIKCPICREIIPCGKFLTNREFLLKV